MRIALALVLVGLLASSRPADACSVAFGPPSPPQFPWWSESAFPTNGLFASSLEWRRPGGEPLALVVDDELTARFGFVLRRPVTPLVPGTVYEPTEDCPASPCRHQLVIGATADTAPPSAPTVGMRTLLIRDPEGAGAFSCPDVDALELTIAGSDDTTPRGHLAIGAYVATDEAAVAAKTELDIVFGPDPGPADGYPGTTATIYLGESVDRVRDGELFRSPDRFCFALALIDWAGNVGARSATRCVDTTDPDDPSVEWVESTGCGCSSGADPGGATLVVLAIGMGARRGRRRQATSGR